MARRRTASEPSGYTVLVVDDQEEALVSNRLLLEKEGHHVLTAASGHEALSLFQPGQVHLVIVDYFMPRMSGEELVQEIRKQDETVQIVLQTGYSGEKPPRQMLRTLDIQGYHDKSEGPDHLLLWVDVALKAFNQLQKVQEAEKLKNQLLLKEEFLANVSHEMRTPLNIILGYSELLLDDPNQSLLPETQQVIEVISKQTHSLEFLVSNFLNFARIEAEAMGMTPQSVQLAELEPEIEQLMGFLLRDKPVTFTWQVNPNLPPVWVDRQKLVLVLQNLLSNAVKFTEQGKVEVWAEPNGRPDEVTLEVRDMGVGIAPENHEAIFELFRRVDESSTHCFGGTGVGLTLARKLARMMDGEISVKSRLGEGAIFILKLKVSPEFSSSYCTSLP